MTEEQDMTTNDTTQSTKSALEDEERTLRALIQQLPALAVAFARSNEDKHQPRKRGEQHTV